MPGDMGSKSTVRSEESSCLDCSIFGRRLFRTRHPYDEVDQTDHELSIRRRSTRNSLQQTTLNDKSVDRQTSYAPSVNFSEDAGHKRTQPITAEVAFFKNFSYETVGHPFMRVAHDIAMDEVVHIFQQDWRLTSPRIILQIVSNLSSLSSWQNMRQLENFSKGLIKAANTTSMWIVTPGLNVGISKVIGDARADEMKKREAFKCHKHRKYHNRGKSSHQPLTLLGIMREDNLSYADSLDCSLGRVEIENEGNSVDDRRYELNPDHSHYIIVKDGTFNRTGLNHFVLHWQQTVINTSAQHAQIATEDMGKSILHTGNESLSIIAVPIVAVLVDGGYECARLILDTLKKGIPVVVIRGSGGLADLIAYTYYSILQRGDRIWDTEYIEEFLKPELSLKIAEHFPALRENQLTRNLFRERIIDCVRQANKNQQVYLTILNIHSYSCNLEDLGDYILRALFKSQQPDHNWDLQMQKDLILTLDWNSEHLATTEVFRKDPSFKFKVDKTVFERALTQADREGFVDLFLKQGFQLHKYLTPRRLRNLFNKTQDQEFFHTVCWEGVLGHPAYTKPNKFFLENDLNWLIEQLIDIRQFINSQEMHLNAMSMYVVDASSAERKSLTILTMWAVLTDRSRLAKILWKHSDQPVHLALVISMMYDRVLYFVTDSVMVKKVEELRQDFSDMATSVLDASFEESVCRAKEVLSEESPDWGMKTAVDLAASANNRTFMSHQCCQKWLTSVFMGKIRIRDMSWGPFTLPQWTKVILSATLVFPMYIWVVFVRDQDQHELLEEEIEVDETDHEDGHHDHSEKNSHIHGSVLARQTSNERGGNVFAPVKGRSATLLRNREVFITSHLNIFQMVAIMWSAPITKFWMFQIFYMGFLGLFSIAVLWPSCGNYYLDVSICAWITLIILENIRRTSILYKKYASVPLFLKILEILLFIMFVTFYINVRVIFVFNYVDDYVDKYSIKVVLCVGLLYFYFRLIAIYLPISPTLGPLLYRVKLMVLVDFVNFMRMAVLVIMSGGIVIHVVLYPDHPLNWELFRKIFHRAWFSMYLTPIDDLDPNKRSSSCKPVNRDDDCEYWNCSSQCYDRNSSACFAGNWTDYNCPNTGVWPYLFSVQYFVLLKLILLTLLYALFSATAGKLISESDSIWKYQRYRLVMDFASRLRLPAPLSILSFFLLFLEFLFKTLICSYCRKTDTVDGLLRPPDSHEAGKDYSYWRHLAQEYSRKKDSKDKEMQKMEKQLERLMSMADDLEYQKTCQKQVKSRVRDLERITNQAVIHLELVKHMIEKKEEGIKSQTFLHMLARTSPYPSTRVQRLPVPDKYVPWEVMWVEYDPVAYTRPKSDFPIDLQNWVDEDILLLRHIQGSDEKLPVLQWNSVTMNAAGISIDRSSWILGHDAKAQIYKLEEGIPRNPMGRTGLRGRGALPRWGSNHYILIVITRWLKTRVSMASKGLEFVIQRTERRDQFSIPGSFVPGEQKFEVIQNLFKQTETGSSPWNKESDLFDFFSKCRHLNDVDAVDGSEEASVPGTSFICHKVVRGYMDDPWNTDNTWKEVELWHVHFPGIENVAEKLKKNLNWRVVTEDVFSKLPAGQGKLFTEIVNRLKPAVL